MTTVYFVRHAQPNYENHDDMLRELTFNGTECVGIKQYNLFETK